MTLGTALVIIMVLYLVDRNKKWKMAVTFTMSLAALSLLGWGAWYEVTSWMDKREIQKESEKPKSAGLVPADVREQVVRQIEDCISKSTPAGNVSAADYHRQWCEQHPDTPFTIVADPSEVTPIPRWATVGERGSDVWCLVVSLSPHKCEPLYSSRTPSNLPSDWRFESDKLVPCSIYYKDKCPSGSWVRNH
jgi:hypothetical protein